VNANAQDFLGNTPLMSAIKLPQAGPADGSGTQLTRVFSSRAATSLRHAFLCTDHAAVWHATPQ
jgi:hypothetical protein